MRIKDINLKIIKDDITELNVDAIVNAANSELRMGNGLAGIIKKKGGESVEAEAVKKGPVAPGQAVWTSSGELTSQYIIHSVTVGDAAKIDEKIIRDAVANALQCAAELKIESVALPALGCGVGEFSLVGSAKIIAQEILKFARRNDQSTVTEIILCLYDEETFSTFETTVRGYIDHIQDDLGSGPYVTVDVIIELTEGIILIERSNPPYGWALPGGFVDSGESLETAVSREAKEETNMELINLRQFHVYSDPDRDPRFHTVSTVFVAEGKGIPQFGDDAKGLKIVKYDDLLTLDYAFDHKQIIKDYIQRNRQS